MESQQNLCVPKVCIFDSGIGGLNLLAACVKKMPYINYRYYADNYNVPYGNLSDSKLLELVTVIFDKIAESEPNLAVIACNTVTARCAAYLRKRYSFPIVGMQPAVKPAAKCGDRCLVLATQATATSASLSELVKRCGAPQTIIYPCRDLAGFIERNIFCLPEVLPKELLPDIVADSVVLGCTHYSFVREQIEKRYEKPVFDGIVGTVDHIKQLLGFSDHFFTNCGKIDFICGDIDKNRRVFNNLAKNKM